MKARILSIVTAVSLCLISWSLIAYAEGIVGPLVPAPGQQPGTTTNDNAAPGNVGQLVISGSLRQQSATVTITIASPAVISWTANPFFTRPGDGATPIPACASLVSFTTTGALPTGITSGVPYYVTCGASLTANAFQISTSTANAIAGTSVNTSGTQSGTQTGAASAAISSGGGGAIDFGAMSLSAGDWEVSGVASYSPGASTSITQYLEEIGTTSGSVSFANAYTVNQRQFAAQVAAGGTDIEVMTPMRVSLSSTTTLFCVMASTFTVTSTITANGMCRAKRNR